MGDRVHPELRLARALPRGLLRPRRLRLLREWFRLEATIRRGTEVVAVDEHVAVRLHRPPSGRSPAPALLWIHGGGLVMGSAAMDDARCRRIAADLDVVVAAVEHRLAPEHPHPAAIDDCHTALRWLADHEAVDGGRIAIGGASAGGGLAAALALLARDRGPVDPVLQLLAYPMLDDRTTLRTDLDDLDVRLWDQESNRFGWRAHLGDRVGDPDAVPALAAPARARDLDGLPPAWVGVGTLDIFHDEDVAYATRLEVAGVPTILHVVPGAYHAFDVVEPWAGVSRQFVASQLDALARAFDEPRPGDG